MFQPKFEVSPSLLAAIKRIAVLVHELNKRRPSDLVLAQLQHEAVVTSTFASTSIEGNPLPLTEVRRILKTEPEEIRQSEREVLNYNRILGELNTEPAAPFTADLLRHIQREVMAGLLPEHHLGAWRQEPAIVHDPRTGGIVFLPPDHQDVATLMDDLVTFVQEQRDMLDPLILAGLFHKQFVVVHPFVDGNGRTARLATQMLLSGLGVDLFRLLSFENYYHQNVTRYFQMVGPFGNYYDLAGKVDFTPWLEYFAEGILNELLRLEKQLDQFSSGPETRLEEYHRAILDYIDQHGFITDRDYAQFTVRAKATRALDFRKLIEMELIERKGSGRKIHYVRSA
ncbi:MAG: Fic family protein [Caldilineaceae bacterium]|nr:Fic family protein [Caldilineaceae bacterium]